MKLVILMFVSILLSSCGKDDEIVKKQSTDPVGRARLAAPSR